MKPPQTIGPWQLVSIDSTLKGNTTIQYLLTYHLPTNHRCTLSIRYNAPHIIEHWVRNEHLYLTRLETTYDTPIPYSPKALTKILNTVSTQLTIDNL